MKHSCEAVLDNSPLVEALVVKEKPGGNIFSLQVEIKVNIIVDSSNICVFKET